MVVSGMQGEKAKGLTNMKKAKNINTVGVCLAALALLSLGFGVPVTQAAAAKTTTKQAPPISLGTSGGWRYDLANGYCCSGTLGCLVQLSGKKCILSNFHVLAGDVVAGGNNRVAKVGDYIIQPGLVDVNCIAGGAQNVATLTAWADPVIYNRRGANVDAAIAEVISDMVRDDGAILNIGTISSQTWTASVGQGVKKCGRTTGLTASTVGGLNATVRVQYDRECGSRKVYGTATFTGQILVVNPNNGFLNAGDSGSLLVENVDPNPRSVGLLFAGSSGANGVAVANPINDVLVRFGATMVGVATGASARVATAGEHPMIAFLVGEAVAAQERHARLLESVPRAVGHCVGPDEQTGNIVIKVLLEKDTPEARAAVPYAVDGVPVVIQETGRIVAY